MKTCVIFNPVAKGNKARHFRRDLERIGGACALKPTAAAGDARRLAAVAVEEGFRIIVAAGGDGTVNEVLNGLGDAPNGFERSSLGVLPLGTVNVFARELALPFSLRAAWEVVRQGKERRVDLPQAEFQAAHGRERRYFAQLAGAGLDARAIELVNWTLKKRIGPLAYVVAGFQAIRANPSSITAASATCTGIGELVLVGNGRRYGGRYQLFPQADLSDGRLDVCVFPQANLRNVFRCAPSLLALGRLPRSIHMDFQASTFSLTSPTRTPFEVDGELAGHLPATMTLKPGGLRLIVP